jgi:phosphoglycolate phosphatase
MALDAPPLAKGGDAMTRPAALLDLDGTLIDSLPGIVACMRAAMARMGHGLDPREDLTWAVGPPTEDVFVNLLGRFGDARVAETVAIYRTLYGERYWSEASPYPGVADALAALTEAGIALYVATSKRVDFAARVLAHFGLDRPFAAIHGAEDGGLRSHKAELIAYVLESHGLTRARTVMVGDRRHDIAGAHANKLRSVGALWGYGGAAELTEAGADALAERPDRMPGAVRRLLRLP